MDSRMIFKELQKILVRYRAGLISKDQSRDELAFLLAMMKAYELTTIEDRIDQLQAVLDERR
jgi:hypothetical protein